MVWLVSHSQICSRFGGCCIHRVP